MIHDININDVLLAKYTKKIVWMVFYGCMVVHRNHYYLELNESLWSLFGCRCTTWWSRGQKLLLLAVWSFPIWFLWTTHEHWQSNTNTVICLLLSLPNLKPPIITVVVHSISNHNRLLSCPSDFAPLTSLLGW